MSVLPDPATPFGQRVRSRLRDDEVIWIVTVGADGRPQPNPVGFCQDGEAEFVIYSRPDAHRLEHLRDRPDQVTFHFDSDSRGQDVLVLYGQVVVDDDHPASQDWPPYPAKYGAAVRTAFGDIATAGSGGWPVVRVGCRVGLKQLTYGSRWPDGDRRFVRPAQLDFERDPAAVGPAEPHHCHRLAPCLRGGHGHLLTHSCRCGVSDRFSRHVSSQRLVFEAELPGFGARPLQVEC
jgi:PPOX class probable F420-dependent enzyme